MKRKKSAKTEQEIQKEIIDYLTLNGWLVWKNKNVNRGTGKYLPTFQRGVPDLTALKDGVVWFCEIKTEDGILSKEQEEFRDKILKKHGLWCLLRSIENAKEMNRVTELIK